MTIADAWATETTTITTAKRAELKRKREKGGKKAQRVIELDRLKG